MPATVLVPGESRPGVPSPLDSRLSSPGTTVRRPPVTSPGIDAHARQVAEVVALWDRPLPVSALGRLAGVPRPGVAATRAVAVGLLRLDDSGQLVCADDIRRQAVLRALPAVRRQQLEARVRAHEGSDPPRPVLDPARPTRPATPAATDAQQLGHVDGSQPGATTVQVRSGLAEPRATARPGQLDARLTSRETQVLALVDDGWSNGEIAHELRLSGKTVEFHVSNAFAKLGVASRRERRRQRRG